MDFIILRKQTEFATEYSLGDSVGISVRVVSLEGEEAVEPFIDAEWEEEDSLLDPCSCSVEYEWFTLASARKEWKEF